MSTSPQRGQVVRMVVISPETSAMTRKALRGLRGACGYPELGSVRAVSCQRFAGLGDDLVPEDGGVEDVGMASKAKEEPGEPLRRRRRECHLERAVWAFAHVACQVVLRNPAGGRMQPHPDVHVTVARRVQRAARPREAVRRESLA